MAEEETEEAIGTSEGAEDDNVNDPAEDVTGDDDVAGGDDLGGDDAPGEGGEGAGAI